MHETAEELAWLDELLVRSQRRSGPHLRSIVRAGERTPSAAQVAAELRGMRVLVVTTVSAGGRPRASAVDGHFWHGRWLFTTAGDAVKARDMAERPWVSAAFVDGERFALFTHGRAEILGPEHPERGAADAHLSAHYGASPTTWGPDIVFARIQPTWMVAYAPDAALVGSGPD